MANKEINLNINPNEYYDADYFSGQGEDSPYPKDGRYLDPHHPIIERKFKNLYSAVVEQQPVRHNGILRLLDIGCGPAHTEVIFKEEDPNIKVWNIDGFFKVAQFAHSRNSSNVMTGDLRALPLVDGFFWGSDNLGCDRTC